jgi:hypothetical protein
MEHKVLPLSVADRMQRGLRAASGQMHLQVKIWSRYSNDKIDIAHTLAAVLRTLGKSLPLEQPFTALSIGSSNEPQFRILESACNGGLYLLDIEDAALQVVEERSRRQQTHAVRTLRGDYREVLRDEESVREFRDKQLDGQRPTLITLHHSLYYSPQSFWNQLLTNLYELLLPSDPQPGPSGAIHAVLMASHSDDPTSTTWLYNHFAERFFACHNDQDLRQCAADLRNDARFANARILSKVSRIEFFVDEFEQFMAVVWMVLLHPNVHRFSEDQQREVIEFVYREIWSRGIPLVQMQDHLVIYRGQGIAGLI